MCKELISWKTKNRYNPETKVIGTPEQLLPLKGLLEKENVKYYVQTVYCYDETKGCIR